MTIVQLKLPSSKNFWNIFLPAALRHWNDNSPPSLPPLRSPPLQQFVIFNNYFSILSLHFFFKKNLKKIYLFILIFFNFFFNLQKKIKKI
jgi:hypothetical protein